MFQFHYQTTKPMTTAHLAQTMTLLSLNLDELRQKVESELSSNPALEIVEETRCPKCHRVINQNGICPICSCPDNHSEEDLVVFVSPRDDFSYNRDYSGEEYSDNDMSQAIDDLPTYVLRQVSTELSKNDCVIAAFLLTNLNKDGLLETDIENIANYFHEPLDKISRIKKVVQKCDPVGVCSNSPGEALLVQLEVLKETKDVPQIAYDIVKNDMDLLTRRIYSELAKKYNKTQKEIQEIIKFIGKNLNPFPARSHWGSLGQTENDQINVYHRPDIIISYLNEKNDGQLVVEIIMPNLGSLRINPLFKNAIKNADKEQKEEWKNDLDKASLFVKCLQQRYHTMERLMQKLVYLQKDYIIKGNKFIKPITRVKLSKELDVHESTISRAVANKTVQLPNNKIVPLSSFFDRSLNIRTIIKDIISEEKKPLSDSEIVNKLNEMGIDVARRTVAKYRTMEGILPAHLRQAQIKAT